MKNKKIKYLPQILTIFAGIISLILYNLKTDSFDIIPYVQVIASSLVTIILPFISFFKKTYKTWLLNLVYSIFIICAVDLGSVMGFYDTFLWWDTLMHAIFGFIASLSIYILILDENFKIHNFYMYLTIFLSTLGCGTVWEIFEFTIDRFLDNDTQRVVESIALGHTPVYDTMIDLIISIVGIFVFYLCLWIYNKQNKKID